MSILLRPWSEAPVYEPFRRRRTTAAIFVLSWLALFGLIGFQLATQGRQKVYSSALLSSWAATNDTISCTPSTLAVGSSVYMQPRGLLPWTVVGIEASGDLAGALQYYSDPLSRCVVVSASLTYSFTEQNFYYGICGNCTVGGPISRAAKTVDKVVNVCSTVDLARTALPAWSLQGQDQLQRDIFSIGGTLQRLNIPSGSFTPSSLPPYGTGLAPSANDTTVTPALAASSNLYFGSPLTYSIEDGYRYRDASFASFDAVMDAAMPTVDAAFSLNVVGIGGIRLNSTLVAATAVPPQPPIIAELRGFAYKAVDSLVKLGVGDLQDKSFVGAYPCTRSTLAWKPPITILFVLIGSCLGPFGGILTMLLLIGAYLEASEAQRATARLKRRIDPLPSGEFVDQLRADSRPPSFASFGDYKSPYGLSSPEQPRYSRVGIDDSYDLPSSPQPRLPARSSNYV